MTENAAKLVRPDTFRAITQNPVLVDTFEADRDVPHIELADAADIFVLCPATFNIIGKIACGIADDLVTTIASAVTGRKIVAPAMNVNMYNNPILQKNLNTLVENGYEVIEPDSGMLACGYEGKGRLRNVDDIIRHIYLENQSSKLSGKKILITAGGTIEPIDPVRFIGNRSSGKMGIALADEAKARGCDVTLVYAKISVELPKGLTAIQVSSAIEMQKILEEQINDTDVLIMAAAISDFRVENVSDHKIKRKGEKLTLTLVPNPDLTKELYKFKNDRIYVGFAAESQDLIDNAKKKLEEKNLDLIVANDILSESSGFDSDTNKCCLINRKGLVIDLELQSKIEISKKILDSIEELM